MNQIASEISNMLSSTLSCITALFLLNYLASMQADIPTSPSENWVADCCCRLILTLPGM